MWKTGLAISGLFGFLASQVAAVYSDEANVIDWHRAQIGVVTDIVNFELPSHDNTPASSLLFGVYTESNVLAVLNGTDESIVWRHKLEGPFKSHSLTLLDDSSAVVLAVNSEGSASSRVFQFDLRDGALVWESFLEGEVTAVAYEEKSVYVATEHAVHYLDDGVPVWTAAGNPKDVFVGFVQEGKTLFVASENDEGLQIKQVDVAAQALGDALVLSAGSLLYSKGGLVAWEEEGSVTLAKIENGVVSETISEEGNSILVNPKVAVISSKDKSVVFDVETFAELYVLEGTNAFGKVSGNDEVFVVVDAEGIFSEIEAVTSDNLGKFALGFTGLPIAIGGTRDGVLVQHSNGVLQLVNPTQKIVVQERDESIADVVDALLVDLPDSNEGSLDIDELWYEEHSNLLLAYVSRVRRHLDDLQYLGSAIKRGIWAIVSLETPEQLLSRANMFGVRKCFVSVSKTGRVTAIDTFLNSVMWAMDDVPVAKAMVASVGTTVYIVCQDGTVTVIDALEGKITDTKHLGDSVEELFSTFTGDKKTLFAWTFTDQLVRLEGPGIESFYTTRITDNAVVGYFYEQGNAYKTWEFSAPEGSRIATTASRNPEDVTVNIGNVLGDRTVLYKYLHRNILAVAVTNSDDLSLSVYVLDTVTGRILHSKKHEDSVDVSKGVQLVYGENWLVYTFWSDLPTLGEKVVVWDLYESEIPNERASLAEYSSFDDFALPHVKAQSFFAPVHFSAVTLSRTLFGVTVRDVIAATSTNQIVSIPKRVLEPRRPVDRAATSTEQSEGLYQYDSRLYIDPQKQVLSHGLSVLGTKKILTTSARLESTSMVVAFGFDVFFTRVTPSQQFDVLNSSFAKEKLVYTMGAMLAVVIYLKPFVARRMANAKWGVE